MATDAIKEKFVELVMEALTSGYHRGVDVFTEFLEDDISKEEVLSENSVGDIIDHIMMEAIEENYS